MTEPVVSSLVRRLLSPAGLVLDFLLGALEQAAEVHGVDVDLGKSGAPLKDQPPGDKAGPRCAECKHWNAYETDGSFAPCDAAVDRRRWLLTGPQPVTMLVPDGAVLRTRSDHHCSAFSAVSRMGREARRDHRRPGAVEVVPSPAPRESAETVAGLLRVAAGPLDPVVIARVVEAITANFEDGRDINMSTGEAYPDAVGAAPEVIERGRQWRRGRYARVKATVEAFAGAIAHSLRVVPEVAQEPGSGRPWHAAVAREMAAAWVRAEVGVTEALREWLLSQVARGGADTPGGLESALVVLGWPRNERHRAVLQVELASGAAIRRMQHEQPPQVVVAGGQQTEVDGDVQVATPAKAPASDPAQREEVQRMARDVAAALKLELSPGGPISRSNTLDELRAAFLELYSAAALLRKLPADLHRAMDFPSPAQAALAAEADVHEAMGR